MNPCGGFFHSISQYEEQIDTWFMNHDTYSKNSNSDKGSKLKQKEKLIIETLITGLKVEEKPNKLKSSATCQE